MTTPLITIQIQDGAVTSRLAELGAKVGNLQPFLEMLGEAMRQRTLARFSTGKGPDGVAWAPNAPATLKRKAKIKGVLVESGNLRDSIAAQATAMQLTLSVAQPYAAIHQFGGTIQRKAGTVDVRHRKDAKGDLLRTALFGGKGLVFAKASHERALTRTFDVAAHSITLPARPYMPMRPDGTLYPAEQAEVLASLNDWLGGR